MLFSFYTAKVMSKLQRSLTASELVKLAQFYNRGYSVIYAVEWFK